MSSSRRVFLRNVVPGMRRSRLSGFEIPDSLLIIIFIIVLYCNIFFMLGECICDDDFNNNDNNDGSGSGSGSSRVVVVVVVAVGVGVGVVVVVVVVMVVPFGQR